jgi:hypothetical protein
MVALSIASCAASSICATPGFSSIRTIMLKRPGRTMPVPTVRLKSRHRATCARRML